MCGVNVSLCVLFCFVFKFYFIKCKTGMEFYETEKILLDTPLGEGVNTS